MRCVVTDSLLSYRSHFPCRHGRGDTGEGPKAGAGVFCVTTRVVTRCLSLVDQLVASCHHARPGSVVTSPLQAPSAFVSTLQERFSWFFAGRGRGLAGFFPREALLARSARVVTDPSMPAVDFVPTCHHLSGGRVRGDDRLSPQGRLCHHVAQGRRGDDRRWISPEVCHHVGWLSWMAWRRSAKTRVKSCHHRRGKCVSPDILPRGDDRLPRQARLCHHGRGDRKPTRRAAPCHHGVRGRGDRGPRRRSPWRHHGRGDGVVTASSVIGAVPDFPCHHGRGDRKPLAIFSPVATVVATHRSTAEFGFVTTGVE